MIDIHAHVMSDPIDQVEKAHRAGVDTTTLLSTRVHPEIGTTTAEVRAEFSRLIRVASGEVGDDTSYRLANQELDVALSMTTRTVGMRNISLSASASSVGTSVEAVLADPRIVRVGELTPAPGSAEDIDVIASAIDDSGQPIPVLVHGIEPNTASDIYSYAATARRHPRVPIIVGAFGGFNSLLAIDLASTIPNLYLDLSSALQVFAVAAAIREIPQQVMFGSNSPYGSPAASVATIEAAVHDSGLRRRVLHENATELFQIG